MHYVEISSWKHWEINLNPQYNVNNCPDVVTSLSCVAMIQTNQLAPTIAYLKLCTSGRDTDTQLAAVSDYSSYIMPPICFESNRGSVPTHCTFYSSTNLSTNVQS